MKKHFAILATLCMSMTGLVGCTQEAPPAAPQEEAPAKTEEPKKEEVTSDFEERGKIAVIRNLPSDDHTTQFLAGAVAEGESYGYIVDTFISNGDDARFQELVAQQIQKGYDGFVISHGKAEYSTQMLEPALEKGIDIVTFDTAFADGIVPVGITSTSQDDISLAKLSLDEIVATSANKPAKVLKIWFGPGIPPLDIRDSVYKQYEADGLIETLESIGPSTMDNVQGDVADRVGAVLPKYPEGSVDAMWGSWDELAKGGYTALKEAGRDDINLVSIDISNQDINLMLEDGSVWSATAAVDPYMIGSVSTRILINKLIDQEVPETYNFDAQLIKKSQLSPTTTMNTLGKVVTGWGTTDAFSETLTELKD